MDGTTWAPHHAQLVLLWRMAKADEVVNFPHQEESNMVFYWGWFSRDPYQIINPSSLNHNGPD